MSGEVHIETPSQGVRRLVIDSPPMNALDAAMRAQMHAALDDIDADLSVRAVIITGTGKAFCAGEDLKSRTGGGRDTAGFSALLDRAASLRPPIVAAVNGWAVGGGFELAVCSDIRLASTEARFVCAGVNVGLMASAVRLPQLIGVARAKAMLLTGLPHDARTAESYGLVTGVHPPEDLQAAAEALAARLASRAPLSVEATKKVAGLAVSTPAEEIAALQKQILAGLTQSRDHAEAVRAFQEKRQPQFERL